MEFHRSRIHVKYGTLKWNTQAESNNEIQMGEAKVCFALRTVAVSERKNFSSPTSVKQKQRQTWCAQLQERVEVPTAVSVALASRLPSSCRRYSLPSSRQRATAVGASPAPAAREEQARGGAQALPLPLLPPVMLPLPLLPPALWWLGIEFPSPPVEQRQWMWLEIAHQQRGYAG
jgi:hypothetical protein